MSHRATVGSGYGIAAAASRAAARLRPDLPAVFWRLCAGMSLARVGMFVFPFLAYELDKARHLDAGAVAVVMAAFGAGWTFGTPIGGYLADRAGRRRVIVVGNIAAAAACIALGRADTVRAMAAAALAFGLAFDSWRPGAYAMLKESARDDAQGRRAMSLFFWAMNVTAIVGILGAGLLATGAGWIWLCYGNALSCAAFAAAAFLVPESRPAHHEARYSARAVRDWRLLVFALLTLICLSAYQQTMYALPVRLAGDGTSPAAFAIFYATNPVTVGVVQLTIQKRLDKTPSVSACILGMFLIGAGIALTGFVTGATPSLTWFCLASVTWTLGEIILFGPGAHLVTSIAPPGEEGAYTGVWMSTLGLSSITSAAVGAWIIHLPGLRLWGIHLAGLNLLWAACAVMGVVTAAGCGFLARSLASRARLMDGKRHARVEPVSADLPGLAASG